MAGNIYVALRSKLEGSGCRPFGSDLAVRINADTTRFPDVSITCDPDELARLEGITALEKPRIVFEVLSPSTARHDKGDKMWEYQTLASLDMIVLVHPVRRWMSVYERLGADEWRNVTLVFGRELVLRDPAATLTAEEIFGV